MREKRFSYSSRTEYPGGLSSGVLSEGLCPDTNFQDFFVSQHMFTQKALFKK